MARQCDPTVLLEFLQDDMSPEETAHLIEHLESCAECRERLQVMAGLAALDRIEAVPPSSASYGKIGLLAAGLLIALLLTVVYREAAGPRFAEIATNRPFPVFPLQTRATESAALSNALERYAEGGYGEAERLLAAFPDHSDALFFRGVSLYFLERFKEAVSVLEEAGASGGEWEEPAAWYRANALLRLGATDRARQALQRLARSPGSYSNQAEEILQRLAEAVPD